MVTFYKFQNQITRPPYLLSTYDPSQGDLGRPVIFPNEYNSFSGLVTRVRVVVKTF